MKTCPVCQALAFEDAHVCFGCLHEFTEDDVVVEPKTGDEAPPEFRIVFTPIRDSTGTYAWKCAVEGAVTKAGDSQA